MVHCNARYIGPALVGDATFLSGHVSKKENQRAKNGIVTVDFEMKNQNGMLLAKGPAEIRLPLKWNTWGVHASALITRFEIFVIGPKHFADAIVEYG